MAMKQFTYALLLACCLTAPPLRAQYWKRVFDAPGQQEWPRGVTALPDGGCVFVGSKHTPATGWDITLTRLDAAGKVVWQRMIAGPTDDQGETVRITQDGQLMVLANSYESATANVQVTLNKVATATGNAIWSRSYGSNEEDLPRDLLELANGDWAVTGASRSSNTQSRAFIFRTDPQGQLRWFNYYSPSIANEALIALCALPDGNIVAAGGSNVFQDYSNGIIVKAGPDGAQIFKQVLDYGKGEYLSGIFSLPGGRLLGTGLQQLNNQFDGLLVRFDANGMPIDSHLTPRRPIYEAVQFAPDSIAVVGAYNAFSKAYFQVADTSGRPGRSIDFFTQQVTIAFSVAPISGGNGFFVTADEAPALFATSERSLIYKMSPLGHTDEYFIEGRVTSDEDGDCAYTPDEQPLKNWTVQALGSNGAVWVANTDADGHYTLTVPFDSFEVSVIPPNPAWQTCGPYWVTLPATGATVQQDISVLSLGTYASLSIDIGAVALRYSAPNPLTIELRNNGITAADSVTVRFSYDPNKAKVVGATLADTLRLAPDTLLFKIPPGVLNPEQSFSFVVAVELLSASTPNATYQFRADASAKNDLLESWEGAAIQVKGRCEGDSVVFELKNTGADMQDALEYIVIEDNIMGRVAPFQLPEGGVKTIKLPANGSTWRLVAPQEAGFPYGKFSTHAVEACIKPGSSEPVSTGYIGQFPEADAAPQTAIYTATVLETMGLAYKTAFPMGCGDEHRVAPGTELEYQIGFEMPDTLGATAILDTLPDALDSGSFTAGTASTPYRYQLTSTPDGLNIVRFWWDTDRPSRGFIRYRLRQRAGVLLGTAIRNQATVYALNPRGEVVFSNTNPVEHLIDTGGCLRIVALETPETPGNREWAVFPNPSTGLVSFQFTSEINAPQKVYLRILDVAGATILESTCQGARPTLDLSALPAGLYFIQLIAYHNNQPKRYPPLKLTLL